METDDESNQMDLDSTVDNPTESPLGSFFSRVRIRFSSDFFLKNLVVGSDSKTAAQALGISATNSLT